MADSESAICNLALLKIGDTKGLIQSLDDPSDQAQACKLLYPHCRDLHLRNFHWPFAKRRAYPVQLGGSKWSGATTYGLGAYVSFGPNLTTVANPPETVTTFVYVSLVAGNLNNTPDQSPTKWRQVSRAAWAYVFQLPTDIIAIRGLYHGIRDAREDEQVPYAIEYEPSPGPGQILLTDAGLPWEAALGSSTTQVSIEIEYTAQVTDTKQFPEDFSASLSWLLGEHLALALRKDPAEAKRMHDAYVESRAIATSAGLREVRRDLPPAPSAIAARQ